MRLTRNVVIVVMFSLTGTTVAEPHWGDGHSYSYDHDYNTHHNYNSHYAYDSHHVYDSHHAYDAYEQYNEYRAPVENRWQSRRNSKDNTPYYSQDTGRHNGLNSNRAPQYNKGNDSGNTDFYFFKQDKQQAIQQTSFNTKVYGRKQLPLSSLDLEDKLKVKIKIPKISQIENNESRISKVKSRKPEISKSKNSPAKILRIRNNKPEIPKLTTDNIKQAKASLALTLPQCLQKLRQNNIHFSSMPPTWGIKYPVKIHSTIGGVRYRNSSNQSNFSIMDCRLAAALIGWSKVLRQYSIYEVIHMRTYTPGATVRNTGKPSGHRWGLAIDVAKFKSRQYGELNVKYDWSDQRPNISPCIKSPKSAQPLKLLRAIVCKTANKQLFAMILTPHYNRAHHDHLHIELRPRLRKLVLR